MGAKRLVVGVIGLVTVVVIVFLWGALGSSSGDQLPSVSIEDLEEQEVIHLEKERVIFVTYQGEVFALSDDAQHLGGMDRVRYCGSSGLFEAPTHGEKFDIRGHYYAGPGQSGLDRYEIRIEGDRAIADINLRTEGPPRGTPTVEPRGPFCSY